MDQIVNGMVQTLGTFGGLSLIVALLVQSVVKPALYGRYGGKDEAHQNKNYPFVVNVMAIIVAAVVAAVGLFALDGFPVNGSAWATFGGNVLVSAVLAGIAGAGIESAAGNVKQVFLK